MLRPVVVQQNFVGGVKLLGTMGASNSAKLGRLKTIRDTVLTAKLIFGGVRDVISCVVYVELNFVINVEKLDANVMMILGGTEGSLGTEGVSPKRYPAGLTINRRALHFWMPSYWT